MKKYALFIVAIVLTIVGSIIDSNFTIYGVNLSQSLFYVSIACSFCNAACYINSNS